MNRNLEQHPLIRQYLENVCGKVKAKEVHEEIKLELLSHLEERVEDRLQAGGISEEEAISGAIDQIGDPGQIGKQLHAAHKPRMEWTLLGICILLIGIGLVAMLTVKATGNASLANHYVEKKLLYVMLGIGAMACLYFVDYRKLKRYSWYVYGFTVVLLAFVGSNGTVMEGARQWLTIGSFHFNIAAASPYLFMVAFAGLLNMERGNDTGELKRKRWLLLRDIVVFFLLPTFFYFSTSSLASFSIYCFSTLLLLIVSKKYKLVIAGFGVFAVLALWIVQGGIRYHYVWWRLTAFLRPNGDDNFQTARSIEAIHNGGMWGRGFGAVNDRLPFYYSELLYSYLIYSLGWVFGLVIAVLTLLFIVRIVGMAMKLQDRYAKGIIVGLITVMGVQFVWNLLMCIGLMPISSMQLPLVSWNSYTFIELAAVGLILGAYRRKDIIGQSANSLSSHKI